MPKRVDHEQRRAEITDVTWRLIAERGIDATTLREISAAIGMANGSLNHYYPGKNAIIRSAFTYVFDATNARVRERLDGATGLAGLRIFCRELMPIDDVTVLEARVVIPFWQRALTDVDLASVFVEAMDVWRMQLLGFVRAGRADGTITSPTADDVIVEQLLAMLNGFQILAVLTPDATTTEMQWQMVHSFLDGLTVPAASTRPPASTADSDRPAAGRSGSAHETVSDFLPFAETALDVTTGRLPDTDRSAMTMVLLLHRVANSVVYDLESTVHRPAGWSWSAFRLLFALWVSGPQEASRVAALAGMSRAAVSSLAKTLSGSGLVDRVPDTRDRRGVVLTLTEAGTRRLESTFRAHNRREVDWAELLTVDDVATLNTLLTKLARAAQGQDWINHRH